MYLKVHRMPGSGDVVAVCDRELINTTLREGELEVCITGAFYGNCPVTEEEVREALKDACNINLMGRRAVEIAVELGLIEPGNYIMIGKVPHAQIFRI